MVDLKKQLCLFCLGACLTASAGTALPVRAVTGDDLRAFNPVFFGQNANLARGGSWRDPRFVAAFKKLNAGHVRFPAGTLANYWDWEKGWFIAGSNIPYGLAGVKPNPYLISDLKTMYDETGALPVLVLNMLTSSLDDQMKMLREARRIGLPIRYIELGNEFYLNKKDYAEAFPTASAYAQVANKWAEEIRKEFPEAKLAAVGSAIRSWDYERRKTWNRELFPLLRGLDAVTIHVYAGTDFLNEEDRLLEETGLTQPAQTPAPVRKGGVWGDPAEQMQVLNVFNTEEGLLRMLGAPAKRWSQVRDLEGLPDGMDAWLTEYSLFDRSGPVRFTWAHGLFTAAFSMHALDLPQMTLASYHSTFNNPMFAAIYGTENVFGGLVLSDPGAQPQASVPFELSPAGTALSLLGRAAREMDRVASLVFPQTPFLSGEKTPPYPALFGKLFFSDREKRAVVLNLSSKPLDADLQAVFPEGSRVEQYTMSHPRAYAAEVRDVMVHEEQSAGPVRFRPYSISIIQHKGSQ